METNATHKSYLKTEDGKIYELFGAGGKRETGNEKICWVTLIGDREKLIKEIMPREGQWEVVEDGHWIYRFYVESVLTIEQSNEPTKSVFKMRHRDWASNKEAPKREDVNR